jgi:hypothetical protein
LSRSPERLIASATGFSPQKLHYFRTHRMAPLGSRCLRAWKVGKRNYLYDRKDIIRLGGQPAVNGRATEGTAINGQGTPVNGKTQPSGFQKMILEELKGRALTADNLEVRLRTNRKRLYKDGLHFLLDAGLVANDRQIGGYYRPDSPPNSSKKS